MKYEVTIDPDSKSYIAPLLACLLLGALVLFLIFAANSSENPPAAETVPVTPTLATTPSSNAAAQPAPYYSPLNLPPAANGEAAATTSAAAPAPIEPLPTLTARQAAAEASARPPLPNDAASPSQNLQAATGTVAPQTLRCAYGYWPPGITQNTAQAAAARNRNTAPPAIPHQPSANNATSAPTGIFADLMHQVAQRLHMQIQWQQISMDQQLDALRRGQVDMICSPVLLQAHGGVEDVLYSDIIYATTVGLWYKPQGETTAAGVEEFNQPVKRAGVLQDHLSQTLHQLYTPRATPVYYPANTGVFDMMNDLEAGVIDFIFAEDYLMEATRAAAADPDNANSSAPSSAAAADAPPAAATLQRAQRLPRPVILPLSMAVRWEDKVFLGKVNGIIAELLADGFLDDAIKTHARHPDAIVKPEQL